MRQKLIAVGLTMALAGCGGGGSSGSTVGTAPATPATGANVSCTGSCATADSKLSVADVQAIIGQAVSEAQGQGINATIAVTDRVGNVLAVYRMNGARAQVTINSGRGISGGLEGIAIVPTELAAISKAVTGAFLSSEGNAFSTRTASQIVQQHFNPGEIGGPSGPLFGVQFSQLLCSDLIQAPAPALSALGVAGANTVGPKSAPLGLSADPGGFPLYKGGTVVGGVGVSADDTYGLDLNIFDKDRDLDELIATAATFNYGAPVDRRGDRITVDGKLFRYSDVDFADMARPTGQPAAFASLPGKLIDVPGFYSASAILAGTAITTAASGIVADTQDFAGLDAFVLVDSAGASRFRPKDATDALPGNISLKANEVRTVLQEGLKVANAARAQIRLPTNSQARVSLSVIDTNGEILGVVRTRDAPIFGTDVSLQKARTTMFLSSATAAAELSALPDARYLNAQGGFSGINIKFADYVSATRSFFKDPSFLTGQFAISPRTAGNISRPFFPDGIPGTNNGPWGKPIASWSPFSDGIQYDLANNTLGAILGAYIGALPAPGQSGSSPAQIQALLDGVVGVRTAGCANNRHLKNGLQIFPGGFPIYRGEVLIGAIGVSGDGIDQDDMISFLGVYNAGSLLNNGLGHAPKARRADNLVPDNSRLRYVQCPQAPFINSDAQNVCEGK